MKPIDALFANVKWSCTACGKPAGTCDCWVKCECGRTNLRGEACNNVIWHAARTLAADLAESIVDDMAGSYKLFRREYMAARLKRAVIRHAHETLVASFEGVEAAKPGPVETTD